MNDLIDVWVCEGWMMGLMDGCGVCDVLMCVVCL